MQTPTPVWMRRTLSAAGIYNILWGAWAVLFPNAQFEWLGMPRPNYPQFWQCIGMIVGVYGLGYAIAGTDPVRHWPVVFVGFLGKIFGPLGMAQALAQPLVRVLAPGPRWQRGEAQPRQAQALEP